MAKKLRSAKDLERLISDPLLRDLLKIVIGGAVGGFTFGIGVHFAQILVRGTVKGLKQDSPDLLPDVLKEGL